jgi:curved DNA-binding protein CbpA
MASVVASGTSPYAVLGVEPCASIAEIRAAYLRRALELHPDKKGGDGKAFQQLVSAFEILSNACQRHAYDAVRGTAARIGTMRSRQGWSVKEASAARKQQPREACAWLSGGTSCGASVGEKMSGLTAAGPRSCGKICGAKKRTLPLFYKNLPYSHTE